MCNPHSIVLLIVAERVADRESVGGASIRFTIITFYKVHTTTTISCRQNYTAHVHIYTHVVNYCGSYYERQRCT